MATTPDRTNLESYYDDRYRGEYMTTHSDRERRHVRDLLNALESDISSVLDYGCGRGGWIPALRERWPNARISGVDVSEVALERARSTYGSDFHRIEANVAPVPDRSFDVVFSHHVLEHVSDLEATIADVARVTRPGGVAAIVFPCGNTGSFEAGIVDLVHEGKRSSNEAESRRPFFFEDTGHLRRMTSHETISLFAQHRMSLEIAWFANQFWGAMDWIVGSGPSVAMKIFDPSSAVDVGARLRMALYRMLLTPVAVPPAIRRAQSSSHRRSRPWIKRAALRIAQPIGLLAAPIDAALTTLAEREWRLRRHDSAGSEQYLVFRKAAA